MLFVSAGFPRWLSLWVSLLLPPLAGIHVVFAIAAVFLAAHGIARALQVCSAQFIFAARRGCLGGRRGISRSIGHIRIGHGRIAAVSINRIKHRDRHEYLPPRAMRVPEP